MLARYFLMAASFALLVAAIFLWYYCSLIISVTATGKSKDGSQFTYRGTLRIPLNCDMSEYDALRTKAMVNDGIWTLSPFAIKYGIDPKGGIDYEYGVIEDPMLWFPLQWRIGSPEFAFPPSFVSKYNSNTEYRSIVDGMPRDVVLNAFNNNTNLP